MKTLTLSLLFSLTAWAQNTTTSLGIQNYSTIQGPQILLPVLPLPGTSPTNGSTAGPYNVLLSHGGWGLADAGTTGPFYGVYCNGACDYANAFGYRWDISNIVPPGQTMMFYLTFQSPYQGGMLASQFLILWIYNPPVGSQITSPANGSMIQDTRLSMTITTPPAGWPVYLIVGTQGEGSSDVTQGPAAIYGNQPFVDLPSNTTAYVELATPIPGGGGFTEYYYVFPANPNLVMQPSVAVTFGGDLSGAAAVGVPNQVAIDTGTGQNVIMPTTDYPAASLLFSTSEDGNNSSFNVYPNDTWSKAVTNAQPNAPVYMAMVIPGDLEGNPGLMFCVNGSSVTPTSAPCQVGTTDGVGYFAQSGDFSNLGPGCCVDGGPGPISLSETWWVGAISDSAAVGVITYEVFPPGAGLPPAPQTVKIALTKGKKRELKKAGNLHVKQATSTHTVLPGGLHRYDFTLDTLEAEVIRVGHDIGYGDDPWSWTPENIRSFVRPPQNNWTSLGDGWIARKDAERKEASKFFIETDWLPGPVAIMFQGDAKPLILTGDPTDDRRIARHTSIFGDSIKKVVIGPAIKPGSTIPELVANVKDWVGTLNLGGLIPLTKTGIDFAATLDKLKPGTDLEKQVIDCLRNALPRNQ